MKCIAESPDCSLQSGGIGVSAPPSNLKEKTMIEVDAARMIVLMEEQLIWCSISTLT